MAKISPGTMTVAIFAILVGLAGAYTVRHYLHQAPERAPEAVARPAAEKPIYVPVAAREIAVGQKLSINDIVIRQFSAAEFSKSEFAGKAFMPTTEQIVGRMVKEPLQPNQVFHPNNFFPDEMGPGIAERLQPGYRAVSIPIENIGAVQGFARAGSVVDVLFRAALDEESPEITVTLIEGVEVLALDQTVVPGQIAKRDRSSSEKGSVTLAVTPEQAKALKVAEGRGELSLTLRHPEEKGDMQLVSTASRSMTLEEVLGVPHKPKPAQIEIYRAGQKEVVDFSKKNNVASNNAPLNRLVNNPIVQNDAPAQAPATPVAATPGRIANTSTVGANE